MAEFDKDIIVQKIKDKKPLSVAEETWYLTTVMKLPLAEAEKVIAIASNKDKNIILD